MPGPQSSPRAPGKLPSAAHRTSDLAHRSAWRPNSALALKLPHPGNLTWIRRGSLRPWQWLLAPEWAAKYSATNGAPGFERRKLPPSEPRARTPFPWLAEFERERDVRIRPSR